MKKMIIQLFIILFSSSFTQADEICKQNFHLFDKTIGDHSLLFYRETWDGTCRGTSSKFFTLFILPDRVHSTSSTSLIGNWVPRLYQNMTVEKYEVLKDSIGFYYLNDSLYFKAPAYDTMFAEAFNALPKKDVKTWLWECDRDCSSLPRFYNFKPEPIYFHPGGLYINYSFSEVRYYKESNFLILMTDQKLVDESSHTMNGMIILNVDGYNW